MKSTKKVEPKRAPKILPNEPTPVQKLQAEKNGAKSRASTCPNCEALRAQSELLQTRCVALDLELAVLRDEGAKEKVVLKKHISGLGHELIQASGHRTEIKAACSALIENLISALK